MATGQLCECPWVAQPEPSLNPTEHLRRDLKMAVHRSFPSNLMEIERSCREEWEKLPKNRCAKLVASYLKRPKTVIGANGASTKYWAKAVNAYVQVICLFYFLFIYVQRFKTNCVHVFIMGYCLLNVEEKDCKITKCGKGEALWTLSGCTVLVFKYLWP